jgi:1,4-dihydroxy-2-naphthoyl-CoA hydrolase
MFAIKPTLDFLNSMGTGTIAEHLGIVFTEVGEDYLVAKMPVDHRTQQPMKLLHGGASVVLAETLGSVASYLCLKDAKTQRAVGLEINANHVRAVQDGEVFGKVTAIHLGRSTHIWEIRVTTPDGKLVCVSRLTVAVLS